MSVVLGCPVQNRAWVLPYYLKHIYELDYPKKDLTLWFLVNDSKDATLQILEEFAKLHKEEYGKIEIQNDFYGFHPDNRNKGRSSRSFHQFTYVRNKWVEGLKKLNADWVFSVDSDILIPSNCLKKLINNDKDICSMLVNNMAHPRGYGRDCTNVLAKTATKYTHILEYPQDTVFECDVTGAAYLIKRAVFNNTLYQFHPQGEDVGFCINACKNGYKIWCDSTLKPFHIMNDKILDSYKTGAINGL